MACGCGSIVTGSQGTPALYQFFIDQLKGDDCFHVHYAYDKIREDFDWHDETNPERGAAPFALAKTITKALTTAQVKEHQFMENTHSRLHKETSAYLESKCEPGGLDDGVDGVGS